MLKKLLAMASALMIAASFAGCGNSDSDDDSSSKKSDAASSVKEEESKDEDSSEEESKTESEEEKESEADSEAEPEEPSDPAGGGSADEEAIKENITFDMIAIISFNDGSEFDTSWKAQRNDSGDVIEFSMVVDSQMMKDALNEAGKNVDDIEYVNFGIGTECPESLVGSDIYYLEYDVKYDISFEGDGAQMSIGSGDEYMTYFPRLGEKETYYGMPMYVDDVDSIDKYEASFTIDKSNLSLTSFSF